MTSQFDAWLACVSDFAALASPQQHVAPSLVDCTNTDTPQTPILHRRSSMSQIGGSSVCFRQVNSTRTDLVRSEYDRILSGRRFCYTRRVRPHEIGRFCASADTRIPGQRTSKEYSRHCRAMSLHTIHSRESAPLKSYLCCALIGANPI